MTNNGRKAKAARPGRCQVCGCTEDNACAVGCGWANREQTICTACVALEESALAVLKSHFASIAGVIAEWPEKILDLDDLADAEPRARAYVRRELTRRVSAVGQKMRDATKNADLAGLARAS